MKFVALMPIWQRPELTALVMDHWQAIREHYNERDHEGERQSTISVELLAVGSEGDTSRALAEAHGFAYVEAPNESLPEKFNAGFRAARDLAPDAVIMAESDDLFDHDFPRFYLHVMSVEDARYVAFRDLYYCRALDLACAYHPGVDGQVHGAGMAFRRDLLDGCEWSPFDPMGWPGESTERCARRRVGEPTVFTLRGPRPDEEENGSTVGLVLVDIKANLSWTPWNVIVSSLRPTLIDFRDLLRRDLYVRLEALLPSLPGPYVPEPPVPPLPVRPVGRGAPGRRSKVRGRQKQGLTRARRQR